MVKGVDGFRIDSVANLYESVNITQDEPSSGDSSVGGSDYRTLLHPYTTFQPESYEFVIDMRELVDSFTAVDGKPK